ncbi:MAG: hypothetical protein FD129_522 [bacterium]|nr:MAG: hypothetical protein FD129_522 [bacterium]
MIRTRSNHSRLVIEATVALSLVATLSLVGCGTDIATAPAYVSIENDDGASEGEFPLPSRQRVKVPAPEALELTGIGNSGATLVWSVRLDGLTAHIQLDGVRIASVNASDLTFTDTLAKSPGMHYYGVCFENASGKTSKMVFVQGEVLEEPDDSRTDDRPEDGQ